MDDVRRQDRKLLVRELMNPSRVVGSMALVGLLWLSRDTFLWQLSLPWFLALLALIVLFHVNASAKAAKIKRFVNKRFEALWNGCKDRLERFEGVLRQLRRDQIADLNEVPATVRQVAQDLYGALRRADLVSYEVLKSEGQIYSAPPTWTHGSDDPQAQELYRLADKNIAEYKQQFATIMAGVQRAEAQCAVYMTTLDSLRMKLIGYRLSGKSPEISSQAFLESITEAKMQLDAIDHALDELDLAAWPKTISVIPEEQLRNRN
jgi:hypothetical protein